eukprot:COSAG01_NODE_11749_length_1867_cov_3.335407_4_plen_103_part_00
MASYAAVVPTGVQHITRSRGGLLCPRAADAIRRVKPDFATYSMLLHSTTAGSDCALIERLPEVMADMLERNIRPNKQVRSGTIVSCGHRSAAAYPAYQSVLP